MYDSSVMRHANILYLAWLVCSLPGCELLDGQEARQTALKEGLRAAEEQGRTLSLAQLDLSGPGVFTALLRRPLGPKLAELGPRSFQLRSTFTITADGAPQITITDGITLHTDRHGDFSLDHRAESWAVEERDRVDGRRCWWVKGQYFVGRLHGPATHVPINSDEQNACAESALDPLRGFLLLVAPHLTVSSVGVERRQARVTHTVRLGVRPPTSEDDEADADAGVEALVPVPLAFFKASDAARPTAIWGPRPLLFQMYARLLSLDGQMSLDEATGVPLGAKIKARLALQKAGREAVMHADIELTVTSNTAPIEAPDTDRHYVARQRIFAHRAALLGETTLPGKGKVRSLPGPGDAPKLVLGANGRPVPAPSGAPGAAPTSSPLPGPGDAPKLVLGADGALRAAPVGNQATLPGQDLPVDEDAPHPVKLRPPPRDDTAPVVPTAPSPHLGVDRDEDRP